MVLFSGSEPLLGSTSCFGHLVALGWCSLGAAGGKEWTLASFCPNLSLLNHNPLLISQ